MDPRYTLSDMEMDEVSFVDIGDDPEARICLFKRAGGVEGERGSFDGEEVEDSYEDDGDYYVRTETGKVFLVDGYSLTKSASGDAQLEVESATLIYDPEDEAEEYGVVDAHGMPDEGFFRKFANRLFGAVAEVAAGDTEFRQSEGVRDGGVAQRLEKVARENDEGGLMGGLSREGMTAGQIAYVDALEAGEPVATALAKQQEADKAQGQPGSAETQAQARDRARAQQQQQQQAQQQQQQASGQAAPDAGAAPADGELYGGTTRPDDVQGDDGTHNAQLEKMLKGLDPAVAEMFRQQHAQIQKFAAREEEQVYVNKARGFQVLPVNPVEMGPVLQRIAKGRSTEADEKYVLDIMRACEEMAKQGAPLMRSIGTGVGAGSRNPGGTDAQEAARQITEKANKAVSDAKAKGETLSFEVALGKVRQDPDNADLVKSYTGGRQ